MDLLIYIGLPIIFLVVVIFLCIIKPIMNKSSYSSKENSIYIGMTEEALYKACGTPSKTVTIDEHCKLVSYTMDEWKGVLFGGSKHHEITATIKDGKVTHVSTSD